jgi:hypothetical protein
MIAMHPITHLCIATVGNSGRRAPLNATPRWTPFLLEESGVGRRGGEGVKRAPFTGWPCSDAREEHFASRQDDARAHHITCVHHVVCQPWPWEPRSASLAVARVSTLTSCEGGPVRLAAPAGMVLLPVVAVVAVAVLFPPGGGGGVGQVR